jgi:hypothetical protein
MIKIKPAMKKLFSLILIGAAASMFQSCTSGDHVPSEGKDSINSVNDYDAGAKVIDTSKVTTQVGSATMLENAGSGGTRIVRDTAKHTYYAGKPAIATAAPTTMDSTSAKQGMDSTAKKK